ncbi:putative anti-sigma-YlaC factor YlaD [Sinomonas atrocyanea]|uniref:anti-sigma factor family protein n=1 Tax=Sinomonas atrocyanea TaxID=37927 RepID=UPI00277EADD3|nr:zf-HC2 domain-containing protein [Sinomonas atrocyanea]MDP9884902.1 putative anti-sigma-YlaC factor YlaD [Sinomonas atrocyanea]
MSTGPFRPGHEQRADLGAYVLGALSPQERQAVEEHLAECAPCRAELAGLETLPALLDAVPAERAAQIAHDAVRPPEPGTAPRELLARVTRRRRARAAGWAASLAAAAAAFFVAGIALGPTLGAVPPKAAQPSPSATAPAPATTVTLTSGDGAHVDLALVTRAWGTELDLTCRGMPSGGAYTVWVVSAGGAAQQAGGWSSTGYSGRAVLTGATSFELSAIRAVEIRDSAQQTVARTSLG